MIITANNENFDTDALLRSFRAIEQFIRGYIISNECYAHEFKSHIRQRFPLHELVLPIIWMVRNETGQKDYCGEFDRETIESKMAVYEPKMGELIERCKAFANTSDFLYFMQQRVPDRGWLQDVEAYKRILEQMSLSGSLGS